MVGYSLVGCKRTVSVSPTGYPLIGLHGPADPGAWAWDEESYRIIARAKIQSVTLLTGADQTIVNRLMSLGVLSIHARIFNTIHVGEHKTGTQYVQEELHNIQRLYDAGIRRFSIANEPNLYSSFAPEGFGVMWNNGAEFSVWFCQAVDHLTPLFPEAVWGFPAVSLGQGIDGIRYPADKFYAEAWLGRCIADFECIHSYWGYGITEQDSLNEIAKVASNTPKLVIVSEFGNGDLTDKHDKGLQYANFYNLSRKLPKNVQALDCWVMQSSSGFENWTWRGSPIPDIVGDLTTPV